MVFVPYFCLLFRVFLVFACFRPTLFYTGFIILVLVQIQKGGVEQGMDKIRAIRPRRHPTNGEQN